MARAVIAQAFGSPETLALVEIPSPERPADHVRIAVHAASIAFIDQLILSGGSHVKTPLPHIPGIEVAGEVVEAPAGSDLKPGDRVMAILERGHGGLSSDVVVPAEDVYRMPRAMDFASAAGFPTTYRTAHLSLVDRARLQPGEWLLVLGAAGGVGLPGVEIGKALGAKVIAVASSDAKLTVAREQGADFVINGATENLRERVKAITGGRGVDVVFDPVGGDLSEAALRCLAIRGRMVLVGFTSGRFPEIPSNYLVVKSLSLIGGSTEQARPKSEVRQRMAELVAWFDEGKLKPRVTLQFKLADYAAAFRQLGDRASIGRIVLTLD